MSPVTLEVPFADFLVTSLYLSREGNIPSSRQDETRGLQMWSHRPGEAWEPLLGASSHLVQVGQPHSEAGVSVGSASTSHS